MSFNRCIVFDIDDTLYLERDYARSGFRFVGRIVEQRFGKPGFGEIAWRLFETGVRGNIFNLALDELSVTYDRAAIAELVAAYRAHPPEIELSADARHCLETLTDRAALAAVTDGPPESQREKVRALGLTAWLKPIVITWERGEQYAKPHTASFKAVEEATGLVGENCVYVADNPLKDFVGPRRLGWHTVRISRAGGLHYDKPSGEDIDLEMPDLTDVTRLMNL